MFGDLLLAFLERRTRTAPTTKPGYCGHLPQTINWVQGPGGEAARRIVFSSPVEPPRTVTPPPERRPPLPKMAPIKSFGVETKIETKVRTF